MRRLLRQNQRVIESIGGRLRHLGQSVDHLYRISSLFERLNGLHLEMESAAAEVHGLRSEIDLRTQSFDEALAQRLRPIEDMARKWETFGPGLAQIQEVVDRIETSLAEATRRSEALEKRLQDAERLGNLIAHTHAMALRIETGLDALRSQQELGDEIHEQLASYRASIDYEKVYEERWPLVTLGVATYNRAKLLIERCLPSLLSQDYPNLEIVVVGDGCTDETEAAIQKLGDSRIRFVNLPNRSFHPEDPEDYWLTGGGPCGNHVRLLATGDLITQLDDDDEYLPERISKLVTLLKETRAEVVWHPFWAEDNAGNWSINEAADFRLGQVTTGAVLYRSWFKQFDWHPAAYRGREPADWYRFRKMKYVGAKMVRHPEALLRHYRERNQPYLISPPQG